MTHLVMIRHAESASLAERWISGEASCGGITERGKEQAKALHHRLLGNDQLLPDQVISSSMHRATETATIITEGISCRFEITDDFVERRPGECEGMSYQEYEAKYGCPPWSDWRNPLSPGGESDEEFVARVRSALRNVVDAHEGRTIWVICHGGVLMATAHFLMRTSSEDAHWTNPEPTSISEWHRQGRVETAEGWTLDRYNDFAHLQGPLGLM